MDSLCLRGGGIEVFDDEEVDAPLPRSLSFKDLSGSSVLYEDIDEEDTSELSPLTKQCQEIWKTVQLKSVWRPMVRHPFEGTSFVTN